MNEKRASDAVDEDSASRDAKMIAAARQQIADRGQTLESADSSGPWLGGPPPDSFTGYKIIKELHRGGQGVVYQAIQQSTQRKVAIKVMREGPFAGAADRARFDREVHVLGQLNHPHIVAIHDTGSAAGHLYFVMDYIPGQTLDVYMAGGEHTVDETLRLFGKICEAVNAAHLRGVIHRDLKPSNIRVDPDGEPHVLDFGLAKVATSELAGGDAHPTQMTLTGQFVGSLPWASPEQAEGQPGKIDVRTDVYSLGVIMYQMLTGRFPYAVIGPMRDVLDNILTAEPARPSAIGWHGRPGREINDEIDTIVLKCLSKERDRRYQTAGELARDVQHYLSGEPIEAKRDSAGYVLRKHLRKYRLAVAVAAGFVVVITAGLLTSLVLWGQASEERDRAVLAEQEQSRERQRAETAEHEQSRAREEAEQARDQAKIIADFQSSMLAETDIQGMGLAIVDGFERRIREILSKQVEDPGELDRMLHEWRQQTLKAGATNVALAVLDEYVLAKAAKTIEKDFADQPLVRAALQQTVANTYRDIGLHKPALPLQEAALATRRRVLGTQHPDTLSSDGEMGNLLHSMGELKEAEGYYREALETSRRVLGDDHPDTLGAINNMGALVDAMGRPLEAEQYQREALEGHRRVLGNDHPSTLNSIASMGAVLRSVGKPHEAEPYYREALEGKRRVLGNDHPKTLVAMNNIGDLLRSMGRLSEAEPYLAEALEGARRVLGNDHPVTLNLLHNMAWLLMDEGKLDQAEPYMREALQRKRRVLGDDHPDTQASINNMGRLLQVMDKLSEAEPLYREALEGGRRVLGNDHPSTLASLNNMGDLLRSMGKLAEAEPYLAAALEGHRRVLGDEHPNTLVSMHNLADVLRRVGKFEEGEALGAEVVCTARRSPLKGHAFMGAFLSNHGKCLVALERCTEAESALLEAYDILQTAFGPEDQRTVNAIQALVDLYMAWHAAEPGQGYDAKAAEWRAKLEEWQATTQPAESEEEAASPASEPPA